MTEAIGRLLNGPYCLEAELGRGGPCRVYRAYDTPLGCHVAVKAVSASEPGTEGRFRLH